MATNSKVIAVRSGGRFGDRVALLGNKNVNSHHRLMSSSIKQTWMYAFQVPSDATLTSSQSFDDPSTALEDALHFCVFFFSRNTDGNLAQQHEMSSVCRLLSHEEQNVQRDKTASVTLDQMSPDEAGSNHFRCSRSCPTTRSSASFSCCSHPSSQTFFSPQRPRVHGFLGKRVFRRFYFNCLETKSFGSSERARSPPWNHSGNFR